MKQTSASYEHSRIGYPGVKLKWFEEDGKVISKYITVAGIIEPWSWSYESEKHKDFFPNLERELKRFDDYVLRVYENNLQLQG